MCRKKRCRVALYLLVLAGFDDESFGVHASAAVFVCQKNWLQFAADSIDFALDFCNPAAWVTFASNDVSDTDDTDDNDDS